MLTYVTKDKQVMEFEALGENVCSVRVHIPMWGDFVRTEGLVSAIKLIRSHTNLGLKESYDAIKGKTDVTVRELTVTHVSRF